MWRPYPILCAKTYFLATFWKNLGSLSLWYHWQILSFYILFLFKLEGKYIRNTTLQGVPCRELNSGPALQPASALPSELRCTLSALLYFYLLVPFVHPPPPLCGSWYTHLALMNQDAWMQWSVKTPHAASLINYTYSTAFLPVRYSTSWGEGGGGA
jgi:hypothetical protein